jgi:hypothetical protein
MPFPCPVFPICPIRALSLLSIHGCDWPLHFLQVDSPLSSPYATCHCTNLANFCLNMEAVCFSKNFISSSSVHRLITQTTRILLALNTFTAKVDHSRFNNSSLRLATSTLVDLIFQSCSFSLGGKLVQ